MIAALLLLGLGLTEAPAVGATDLGPRLDKLLKHGRIPADNFGIAVYDVSRVPQVLVYGHQEQLSMIPASVTKVATAATVLARLGPSFKFQTVLASEAPVREDGTLAGDLILKGGGDAGFVSESMWYLVNELRRANIRKIEGSVIVDDTSFDQVRADPSRDPERNDRAYDAPVGAMSVNWNSINIFVRPLKLGEAPQVVLDPIDNGYTIDNRAKVIAGEGSALDVTRDKSHIRLRGTIGLAHGEQTIYKNIDDPVDWSGRNLVFFLGQRGITVGGKIKAGKMPGGARVLAKIDSKPVAAHLGDMMKFSNNFVAEMLTKNLSAAAGKTPATLDDGMRLIRANLNAMGIPDDHFTLLNPSGLSRRNRIRAADLALILVQAQKSFAWFAEFLTALPIAGLDGTLKKRMKETPAEGWVRAKTGQLLGVAALAGYAGRKDGGVRAFAFIFNGKPDLGESARHMFDALAAELVQ